MDSSDRQGVACKPRGGGNAVSAGPSGQFSSDQINATSYRVRSDALNGHPLESTGGRTYRVAQVAACPFPANYGSPAAIRELSQTLASWGHSVHVVTYPYGDDLGVGGAKVHRVAGLGKFRGIKVGPSLAKIWFDALLVVKLCQVIKREQVDVIHAHNYEGVLLGLIAKLISGRPLVYNAVNLMSDELHTYRFIRPLFLAKRLALLLDWFVPIFPDHIIAVTETLRDRFLSRGVPAARLSYVPCGVFPEMFDLGDPAALRARHALGSSPVIMYTGVNNAFQRIDYLLRAFSRVVAQEPRAVLMVVSPLVDERELSINRALARSLRVAERVVWIESHSLAELPDYLALATVTVLPRPDIPGHPIKLLNYMAAGKPIVAFAGGAKGLTHMRDALLAPDHDWEALGGSIVSLLRDPVLAARLGQNARALIESSFDWRQLGRQVVNIYGQVSGQEALAPGEAGTASPLDQQPQTGTGNGAGEAARSYTTRSA
jgi:1,2-diacylglycerol 3-alpha-glucosyltransferase